MKNSQILKKFAVLIVICILGLVCFGQEYDKDTTKVIILKLINVEIGIPIHHWEEQYYGVNQGYGEFNLMSYEIVYRIEIYSGNGRPIYEYYDLKWNKLDTNPIFILSYKDFKPDTVRFGK